jgi:hypothetical protein
LWQEGKPLAAPGQNPPAISPPMVIFRRIGVHAEIRTQKMVRGMKEGIYMFELKMMVKKK